MWSNGGSEKGNCKTGTIQLASPRGSDKVQGPPEEERAVTCLSGWILQGHLGKLRGEPARRTPGRTESGGPFILNDGKEIQMDPGGKAVLISQGVRPEEEGTERRTDVEEVHSAEY